VRSEILEIESIDQHMRHVAQSGRELAANGARRSQTKMRFFEFRHRALIAPGQKP
jgi:hypothetical protein